MATLLKVANTAKELDDVFKLRHEVYVIEDGKFGGKPLPSGRIIDHFDTFYDTANIIAYHDGEPVGTIRVTRESELGLPPDGHWDFESYKKTLIKKNKCSFAAAGMLAIRASWRRRRDVIQALMKMATGVVDGWRCTHVIALSNHETTGLYSHLGFEPLSEKFWLEEVGNYVVPMATSFDRPYQWAFGNLIENDLDKFWLNNFARHFERLLLGPQEILFSQGEKAKDAYILDNGWISISRKDMEGRELVLATLSRGALLGELSLIDNDVRSATAITSTNAELIRLDAKVFNEVVEHDPKLCFELLKVYANRIRRTGDLAMIMAFAPQTERVKFALDDLRRQAVPDRKQPTIRVAKIGPKQLARTAGVREFEVRRILEEEKLEGRIDYGERSIRFMSIEAPSC